MKVFGGFVLVCVLVLVGCQSPQYTSFTPLEARLEAVPGGGALYFVLVNTSGQDLHNCTYSAYIWSDENPNPIYRGRPAKRYTGSRQKWEAGKAVRFRSFDRAIEDPILV